MPNPWLARNVGRLPHGGGLLRRRRPNPLLGAYRWRYELGAAALIVVLVLGLVRLAEATRWPVGLVFGATLVVISILVVVAAVHPGLRELLRRRFWTVIIQHRLRTAFHETGLTTWTGRLPAIMWASPQPDGVRVLVWCRAGVEVADFIEVRAALAAACYAADVRVERHARYANLVELIVVIEARESGGPLIGFGDP
jgi:hypothetical protein